MGEVQEPKTAEAEGDRSRSRPARRWVVGGLAVVVVAVVAFVVAQGGGGGGGPLDAIAKAAEVTQHEPGGRAAVKATVTSPDTPGGFTEAGTMVFEEGGRASGTLTIKSQSNGHAGKFTAIADGASSYVSSELLDSIPEGKKWMEVDYSSAETQMGSSNPAEASPQEGLKILERMQGAKEVGKEDIEGVPTRHYRGTLSTARKVFGVETHVLASDVDVWIDAQNRVRRMHLVVTGSVGESDISSTTEMSIDFVEFGRVPKIAVPDPDEVFNATSEIEAQVQSASEGDG